MIERLDIIAYATDEELARAERFARRCNQWTLVYRIKAERATR